ncbi:MAG: hypothetical protein RBQ72_10625 [Desulfobacterium sp.]|nr:hypothetical protein [Desulfobacterium sp.]
MEKLIGSDGSIRFGVFDDPVERINFIDHRLLTCSGKKCLTG